MLSDDIDSLISELSASLPQHAEFETAARNALAGLTCLGPGAAYRLLARLQRQYFDPPLDARPLARRHYKSGLTKLALLPPIG
jgi:hypothetical protein